MEGSAADSSDEAHKGRQSGMWSPLEPKGQLFNDHLAVKHEGWKRVFSQIAADRGEARKFVPGLVAAQVKGQQ